MIIKKIKLENIRSYKNLELEFPKGSILLSGDIGSGKTSILLALQFALFGLQPGQKGTALLKNGENEASVTLELEIEGIPIILERSIKRTKQGISQEYNAITIGKEKEELSTSEMKNKVINILNYPLEFAKKSNLLYKFTVYTPQEQMKEIIEERAEIRLDTLRHVFGVDRYKRIKENSEIFIQKLKEQIKLKEVEIREINLLKENLIRQNEERIVLSKEIANITVDYSSILTEKKELEEKIKGIQKTKEDKQKLDSELRTLQVSLNAKNDLRMRIEKEIILMKKQIAEKVEYSSERLAEVSALLEKHKKSLEELNNKYILMASQISVLTSKKESSFEFKEKISALENCPTCFQSVGKDHKEKISKRTTYDIEEIDREMQRILPEREYLLSQIENEKILVKNYEMDKNTLETNKVKFEHQKIGETKIKSDNMSLERIFLEIKEIEEKIKESKTSIGKFEGVDEVFRRLNETLDALNRRIRLKEIDLAEKKKEQQILEKQIDNLQKEISKKEQIRLQVNYLRELQDWMQEKFLSIITITETNVLAKLRNEFSKIFHEWFSILVPEGLSVSLDEDFTPKIINQDYDLDYDFLSGGERTAVALAYRLALNQVLNSLLSKIKTKDLVILDEPTDGFSLEQLSKIGHIFEQLKSEQVILVSHEQKIEDFVDHIIRIKKDGTSGIERKSFDL
jgi:exonuclease SbcC